MLKTSLACGGQTVRSATDGHLTWGESIEDGHYISRLSAELDPSPETLFPLDLRADVSLDVGNEGDEVSRAFSGLLQNARMTENGQYMVNAQDMTLRLQETKLGGTFGHGFDPLEVMYLVLSAAEGVDLDPATVADLALLRTRRAFVFISPLPGVCIRGGDSVRIAAGELYVPANGMRYDDEVIADAAPDPLPPELSPEVTRVSIPVHASGFVEAIETGLARLRRVLDWLSFRCGLSTPCYLADGGWQFVEWDRADGLARINETDWVYVRDTLPMGSTNRYWLRWSPPTVRDSVVNLGGTDDSRTCQTLEVLGEHLLKGEEELALDERSLLSALHFHRRARQASDRLDQLVAYWNALEFLLSRQSVPGLLEETHLRDTIRQVKSCVPHPATRERLVQALGRAKQASLKEKWEHFCGVHNLRLSQPDEDFLWGHMRGARNSVQHGGHLQGIKQTELDHFGCLVEKAILLAAGLASSLPR